MILTVFAGMADFERSLILERTGVGRAAAKTCGVKFGPKYSLAPKQIEHARQLSEEGMSVAEISVLFRVHRSTLYWALTVTA